jgi:ABC-type dipeptide/oligopeptide/nickel transport system permease component
MKYLGAALLAIVIAAFLAVITGILTARFWGWFEDRTGIESLGHSGPADWVYLFLWMLWGGALFWIFSRRRQA